MKKYIYSIFIVAAFWACDFKDNVSDIKIAAGTADFTTYIALGNSLTAGYQDGALYISGQENSYPAIIARGMNLSYDFNQPLMADDLGGIPSINYTNKRVLAATTSGLAPVIAKGTGTTTLANTYSPDTPFHNLGVPGAKVAHLLAPGYGNPEGLASNPATANPYYVRFASSPTSSVLQDALALAPTFFSLWIGNNDVLGYATSGGDDSNPLTGDAAFARYYETLVAKLTANGAKGVVANIPSVSSIPFFNTVPNNALKLTAEQAKNLTSFFQATEGIVTKMLVKKGIDAEDAQAIAAQYGITFSEGNNRFLIKTETTASNPLGFRQMAKEELLVLTIDQVAMKTQGYGSVAINEEVSTILAKLAGGTAITSAEAKQVLDAVNPIADKDALEAEELVLIKNAVDAFNTSIKAIADKHDLAYVDVNSLMTKLTTTGVRINGVTYTSAFVTGGVFSLDGVHPNQRGYAIVANEFINAINIKYGANLPKVEPNSYPGVAFP